MQCHGRKETINDEVGRALFEACESTDDDISKLFTKVARLIRRQMFVKEEVFNGDLSKERKKNQCLRSS